MHSFFEIKMNSEMRKNLGASVELNYKQLNIIRLSTSNLVY